MKKWFAAIAIVAAVGFAGLARTRLGQQSDGSFLVSSGQRIQLLGKTTRIEGSRPKDMALSPDGKTLAVLTHQRVIVMDLDGKILSEVHAAAAPLGVAWAPNGSSVYASLNGGKIGAFAWDGATLTKTKDLGVEPAGKRGEPGTGGLAVGSDGTIYAALSIRNEVVAIAPDGAIQRTWQTDACPYNVALSPDGRLLAVSNRGGQIVSPNPEQRDPNTGAPFQGTGIANASSAGTAVQIDPRTDVSSGGTVSLISIATPSAEIKTVSAGRQPSGMRFSKDGSLLYIADADEDALSIVDTALGSLKSKLSLSPPRDPAFGQIPTAVAMSPDETQIYVTLGGANAVAVVEKGKVSGYFPTAWYPLAILVTNDRLLIGSAKGIGSRPSSKTTSFGVHDSVGAVQSIPLDQVGDLRASTRLVAKNNGWRDTPGARTNRTPVPVPERIGEPSVFKHVVYIIKENMAYDMAMGDISSGNGDPSLCVFPQTVTPNHHELARRFGLLDNFYISGTNSADGHQWVDSSIANDYTERNYGANQRSYPFDGNDPLAFSPAGFLWTQAKAAGKSVRVFGEFVDHPVITDTKTGRGPDWRRCWEDYKSGKHEVVVRAMTAEAGLRDSLDPTYIGFPLTVSDQWRADVFLGELKQWESGGDMPNLSILLLPNDHTGGTSPGWPTPRAYVADNDYALGRIVEGISRSKFWPETLILVAEDDSQNGVDHVDGHRSIAFCISAYSHANVTVDEMYTHVSIASTIDHVLGMPPMTRFDRTAVPMYGCFGDKADLTPYAVVPNHVAIDEVNPPAKRAGSAEARKLAEACARMDWSKPDIQDDEIVNRAIWLKEAPRSVGRAGYATKFPVGRDISDR